MCVKEQNSFSKASFNEAKRNEFEDPFSELLRDPQDAVIKEIEENSPLKTAQVFNKSMADFIGRVGAAAVVQYPVTRYNSAVSAKALAIDTKPITYKQALKNFDRMPLWNYRINQASRMFSHRVQAVVLPATVWEMFGKLTGDVSLSLLGYSASSAGFAASTRREARLQFESANGTRFSPLSGLDITKEMSLEQFSKYYDSPDAKEHVEKGYKIYCDKLDKAGVKESASLDGYKKYEWKALQKRVVVFNLNPSPQVYWLTSRNSFSGMAILTSNKVSNYFVDKYGERIERATSISKEQLHTIVQYAYSAACIWISTCCHAAFARCSHGIKSSEQVSKSFQESVCQGRMDILFPGAFKRVVAGLMLAGAFNEGPKLMQWCLDNTDIFSAEERAAQAKESLKRYSKFTYENMKGLLKTSIAEFEKFAAEVVKNTPEDSEHPNPIVEKSVSTKLSEEQSNRRV